MTFQQDTEFTPVIFRKYGVKRGNDVVALFFTEPGTYDPYTCSSYVHVGQHGSADPIYVMSTTRSATPEEYAELKHELESAPYGYRLKVYRRIPRNAFKMRRAALQNTLVDYAQGI